MFPVVTAVLLLRCSGKKNIMFLLKISVFINTNTAGNLNVDFKISCCPCLHMLTHRGPSPTTQTLKLRVPAPPHTEVRYEQRDVTRLVEFKYTKSLTCL